MSQRLQQYILDHYESNSLSERHLISTPLGDTPIQIDDQDDSDDISCFCNIFVVVYPGNFLEIELHGPVPVTEEIADLIEIYDGTINQEQQIISIRLKPVQIKVLLDFASKLKKTVFMGSSVNNPGWHRISARTISSIHRFVRIIKEYKSTKAKSLV